LAGSTALYYPENLPIEMQTATVTEIKRDGEIILQRRSVDHTKISDADFSIEIRENLTSGMTEVIAQNQPRLQPPFAEIGLSDAIVYLLCRVNRPRVVVRSSEKDALVIIRECNRNPRTGLPDAIRGHPERPKLCQTIFAAFLRQYLDWRELSPVLTAKVLYEVISASNGTVHGFVASLVLAIENLFNQLIAPPSELSKEAFQSLRQHLDQWPGDPEMKSRAKGLLSNLAKRSSKSILKDLAAASVVTSDEVNSWLKPRPKIAHGEIVDISNEEIWTHRGRLITMFHRLILRIIGYRGPITDFSGSELQFIDFDWQ
jgi:hypothetical protein